MKVKVWRVEHRDNGRIGMYNKEYHAFINATEGDCDATATEKHPSPMTDDPLGFWDLGNSCEWNFGFSSLAQMRNWIYKAKWRRNLAKLDFVLACYEVDAEHFRRSNFQAIFWFDMAERIEVRDVDYADKSRVKS